MGIERRLRHQVTIARYTPGPGETAWGKAVATYVDDATPTRALVQEHTPKELQGPDNDQTSVVDTGMWFAFGTAPGGRDRVTFNGHTYEVVGPPRDPGGRGRHQKVEARRIAP